MMPTKRDLAVSVLTTALVLAATYYGGPLAGKATKAFVVPRVEEKLGVTLREKPGDAGTIQIIEPGKPTQEYSLGGITLGGVMSGRERIASVRGGRVERTWTRADLARLERKAAELDRRDALERASGRALLRDGVFPVTTHEARP